MESGYITDVPGVKLGNIEDREALTGCTVILTEEGATCGVDVRGSAPGTRETDLLNPINLVDQVHGICLAGGSAFGLDAASGVMNYLEEKDVGLDVGVTKVPIVPSAVLLDLHVGDASIRPDKKMGYEAAKTASSTPFSLGNTGAGCGATVGKLAGLSACMKGGLGSASISLDSGLIVGAVVAVNAVGDVRDPSTQKLLAGPYDKRSGKILDSLSLLEEASSKNLLPGANTTIGVVAANAKLSKSEATKVAQVSQNALARTIFPAHTMLDGDTIFALGTGEKSYAVDLIASLATEALQKAIILAIKHAEEIPGIPSYCHLKMNEKG